MVARIAGTMIVSVAALIVVSLLPLSKSSRLETCTVARMTFSKSMMMSIIRL
jgi:hypothetical protein